MSWVRIDDQYPEHPKIVAVGTVGMALHIASICYCARQLTDGEFATAVVGRLTDLRGGAQTKVIASLVDAGLWERIPDGFRVHDYLQYNPSRAFVLNKRAKDSARKSGGILTESNAPRARDPLPLPLPLPLINPNQPPAAPPADQVLRERPNIFKLYEQLFGKGVSPLIAQKLLDYETEWDAECVEHCFVEAADANARTMSMVYKILDRHKREGCYAERSGYSGADQRSERNGNNAAASGAVSVRPPAYGPEPVFLMDGAGATDWDEGVDPASPSSWLDVGGGAATQGESHEEGNERDVLAASGGAGL